MHALACLIFIALAYAIRGNPALYKGPMGSKDAPIGKFPYQVILTYNISDEPNPPSHYCGGSILNNLNILTSASCFDMLKKDKVKAYVGTNFFAVPGDIYNVADVIIHEDYINGSIDDVTNDIALVHLETSIEYNKLVQPINFMTSDKDLFGNPCTLSGWRKAERFDVGIDPLQEIELTVYKPNACWERDQEDSATTQFCALTTDATGTGFNYNSGSPLVANGNQIGILQLNVPPTLSAPYQPRLKIFTRVSDFVKWIGMNLKNSTDIN